MADHSQKLDPRVVRSQSLLKNALLELIKEKNFNEITIQDIADRSTLNRVTFYLHFNNKHDLLQHLTRDLIQRELETISLPDSSGESVSYPQAITILERYFEFIRKNAVLLRSLTGENGVLSFAHDLEEMIYALNLSRFQKALGRAGRPDPETEMTFRHLAAGMLGVIRWWLEHDMPFPPRQMAERIMALNQHGYYQSLGISARQEEDPALPG